MSFEANLIQWIESSFDSSFPNALTPHQANSGNVAADETRARSGQSPSPFEGSALDAFLQSSPDATIICAADGLMRFINPAAQRLLGYNALEIIGQKFASLLMPVPADELALSQNYWDGAASSGLLRARKRNAEIFPVELARTEITAPEGSFVFVRMRETSSKQRLEQRNAELVQEILHLSRYKVLGELASAITHELNQPLTAIAGYAAAARATAAHAGGDEAREQTELLDKLAGQTVRCGQIVQRLKRLVGERSIDRVYGDLCSTVEESVQIAAMGWAKHGIDISVSVPPKPLITLMDRLQIQLLVTNLVRNAMDELAAWPHERKIEVSLALVSGDMAELIVADTGPGIAPGAFESIFDSFHTTKPEGLGVGLALARRIAEAHKGHLSAANRPTGGAAFRFRVPTHASVRVGE